MPAELPSDGKPETHLSVECGEHALDVRDHGLHLDDQDRRRTGMPSEDVDGAAFAGDRERDLGRDLPAPTSQKSHDLFDQSRMVRVEQTIQGFAVPVEPDLETSAKRLGNPVESSDGHSIAAARFRAGHSRRRDVSLCREVDLTPAMATSKGTHRATQTNHVGHDRKDPRWRFTADWLQCHVADEQRSSRPLEATIQA